MEVDLFIHGVPHGWDYWGVEADRTYAANFYKPNPVPQELVVETRISGSRPYAYYHYLLHADIVDYDGRDGSYVGLTLRTDAYCTPVQYVWMVLDRLFHQHLSPLLFQPSGTRLKWRLSSLRQADKPLAAAQQQLLQLMASILRADDFEPLDSNIATRTNTGVSICTVDATNALVRQSVWQYGRVSIAPVHAAERERQADAAHKKQVSALNAAAQQLKDACQQQRFESQQAVAALQQQVQTQQSELVRLQEALRVSERQLEQVIGGEDTDRRHTPAVPFGLSPRVMYWLPYVVITLLVLVIVLAVLILSGGRNTPEPAPDTVAPVADSLAVPASDSLTISATTPVPELVSDGSSAENPTSSSANPLP